jgi:hypothetical protein
MNAQALRPHPNRSPLADAVALAQRGFRLFPVASNDKKPLRQGWQDEASSDVIAVFNSFATAPPDCNIGIDCRGMIVVDVDAYKEGASQTFDGLRTEGVLPDTLTVQTPRGGLHLYYGGATARNGVGVLGPGIDIRSDDGLVVAPGSQIDGKFYEVVNDVPMLPAPASLIARLGAPRERKAIDQAPVVELDTPEILEDARVFLADAPPAIDGQGGHDCLGRVSRTLKDLGVSSAKAVELMMEPGGWNARCTPPWSVEELHQQVPSFYSSATERRPGVESRAYRLKVLGEGAPVVQQAVAGLPWLQAAVASPQTALRPAGFRFFRHGEDWRSSTRWLYPDLLPAQGVAILVGPSGAGKSFLGLHLAVSSATGGPFFGVAPDERGGTIYVATEAAAALRRRLHAAAGEHSRLPITIVEAGGLGAPQECERLFAEIVNESALMQVGHRVPCRLVIVDTLSASGLLEDENDNAKAAKALAVFEQLSKRTGALVVVVHHPPKTGEGERGAGALRANVDAILTLEQEGREKDRRLTLTKSRDAECPRTIGAFRLEPVELGKDDRGRPIKTCRLAETIAGPAPKGSKVPARFELFNESLYWATLDEDEVVIIDGKRAVEFEIVREIFKERKEGDRDPANIRRDFKKCVECAVALGTVELIEQGRRKYLAPIASVIQSAE